MNVRGHCTSPHGPGRASPPGFGPRARRTALGRGLATRTPGSPRPPLADRGYTPQRPGTLRGADLPCEEARRCGWGAHRVAGGGPPPSRDARLQAGPGVTAGGPHVGLPRPHVPACVGRRIGLPLRRGAVIVPVDRTGVGSEADRAGARRRSGRLAERTDASQGPGALRGVGLFCEGGPGSGRESLRGRVGAAARGPGVAPRTRGPCRIAAADFADPAYTSQRPGALRGAGLPCEVLACPARCWPGPARPPPSS